MRKRVGLPRGRLCVAAAVTQQEFQGPAATAPPAASFSTPRSPRATFFVLLDRGDALVSCRGLKSFRPLAPLQDQKREEKVSKRVNAIQEVNESVALLTQLLQDYDGAAANQSNAELLQVTASLGRTQCS